MDADKNKLFDFSNAKVGDRVTRIYQTDGWDAEILEITDKYIICGMNVDTYRTMKFDRKTGISEHGKTFGFIINQPMEKSYDFINKLKTDSEKLSNNQSIIGMVGDVAGGVVEGIIVGDVIESVLEVSADIIDSID